MQIVLWILWGCKVPVHKRDIWIVRLLGRYTYCTRQLIISMPQYF